MVEERNKGVEDKNSLVVMMDDDSKPAREGGRASMGR